MLKSSVAITGAYCINDALVTMPFLIGNDTGYLVLHETIDLAEERARLEAELNRLRGFLKGVEKVFR